MLDKEQMDAMCEEAFAEDEIEKYVDLSLDPMDIYLFIKGNPEAIAKFRKLHAKEQADR